MKVYFLLTTGVPSELYAKVSGLLSSSEDVFEFKSIEERVEFEVDLLTWELIFDECSKFREKKKLADDDFIILLTEKPNDHNWFSACDPQRTRSIFIHTGDWNYYVPSGPEYPIAYEVIENILERLMYQDFQAMLDHVHEQPRGCISDMCSWKPEIILKLRTADICSDCLEILNEQNVPFQVIQGSVDILERIRKGVLYSSQYRQIIEDDQNLPFPAAITLRKLKNTQEPLSKFLSLLDHFDSLVRTFILLAGPVMLGEGFANFYKDNGLDGRPSLGYWVNALRSFTKVLQNTEIRLDKEILDGIREVTKFSEREHIVNLRNDRRGHGYINPNNETYRTDFEHYRPVIQEIEKRFLPFFTSYKLCQVLTSGRLSNTSFLIKVYMLMGSHPDFSQMELRVQPSKFEDIPMVNQAYLISHDLQRWILMSPYIRYSECSECHYPRVLVADGEVYIDPYIGHRVKLPQ